MVLRFERLQKFLDQLVENHRILLTLDRVAKLIDPRTFFRRHRMRIYPPGTRLRQVVPRRICCLMGAP